AKYRVSNREEGEYGIPPIKAVPILAYYLSSAQNDVEHGWMQSNFPYFYNSPLVYKRDWVDLYSQILNDYVKGLIPSGSAAASFLNKDYYFMRYGEYTIDMQYVLPGGFRGSSYQYDFKNNNRFR